MVFIFRTVYVFNNAQMAQNQFCKIKNFTVNYVMKQTAQRLP